MKIMVDLETLSTEPTAAIIAIGAVAFDKDHVSDNAFYAAVKLESNTELKRHISPSTVQWWMQQSEAARDVFGDPNAVGIRMALEGFTTFCKANNADEMWGNGADFDNVILGASYGAIGQRPPWKYSNNRCFRTLKNLIPVDAANELWEKHAKGTHHNALDDAVRQAHIAVDIFKMLRV